MFRPRRSRSWPVLRRLRILFLPVPSQALGLLLLAVVLGSALVSVPLVPASAEQGAWERERARQDQAVGATLSSSTQPRSEEHTSELQSRQYLVCRLLLEQTNHL